MNCGIAVLRVEIRGIWMRSFSRSMENGRICGELSIRMATCWISSCRADATQRRPNASSANCAYGLQYVPRVIITDKLKSNGAAKREILPDVEHRQHKGLHNRAENSHQFLRNTSAIIFTFLVKLTIPDHRYCQPDDVQQRPDRRLV